MVARADGLRLETVDNDAFCSIGVVLVWLTVATSDRPSSSGAPENCQVVFSTLPWLLLFQTPMHRLPQAVPVFPQQQVQPRPVHPQASLKRSGRSRVELF